MARLPTVPVAIALGSNLGDRGTHLTFAVDQLSELLTDLRVSSWHETDPVDVEPQSRFLNGAVTGSTSLPPRALLDRMKAIENARNRQRPHAGAPRTLDLDLILYGGQIIEEPGLQVPHSRFRERLFVLEPLAEIAADWVDPGTGRTVGELLQKAQGKRQKAKNDPT